MPMILVHHDMSKGVDHWLSSPKREEFLEPLGITDLRLFVDSQDSTHVAVVMDVVDMDRLIAAMNTPEAAAAMEDDGGRCFVAPHPRRAVGRFQATLDCSGVGCRCAGHPAVNRARTKANGVRDPLGGRPLSLRELTHRVGARRVGGSSAAP
jgi:hypothetical protein